MPAREDNTPQTGRLLIVFSRNPVRGKVKTRLARRTSPDFALAVYERLRKITLNAIQSTDADLQIWYTDSIPVRDLLLEHPAEALLQQRGDLGDRMAGAFRRGFEQGYRKIILIGTDCPGITPGIIRKGFALLDTHDSVIGPAVDGGYYLIGLSFFFADIFDGIPWSTPDVCPMTRRKLRAAGRTVADLETLSDIDTLDDLRNSSLIIP
ncbi:MAG: TIGR04282 family arsenosugar biosynthesis glycosyltransferase [Prosthecochloris sp.]|nr:TIGR04282 family arsenosugar biosynthesis glycosyltransferase [Prosthecochloris sp.]